MPSSDRCNEFSINRGQEQVLQVAAERQLGQQEDVLRGASVRQLPGGRYRGLLVAGLTALR